MQTSFMLISYISLLLETSLGAGQKNVKQEKGEGWFIAFPGI